MGTNTALWIQPVAASYEMSSGRLGSTVAAAAGLIAIVLGGLALARRTARTSRTGADSDGPVGGAWPDRSTMAMGLGLLGMALGGLVAATAEGGVGTGNGLGGAFLAMALGLIGVVLGGLARLRQDVTTQQPRRQS
jgi:hypothetical protein